MRLALSGMHRAGALLAVLLLLFGLTACGGSDDGMFDDKQAGPSDPPAAGPDPQPDPDPEPGDVEISGTVLAPAGNGHLTAADIDLASLAVNEVVRLRGQVDGFLVKAGSSVEEAVTNLAQAADPLMNAELSELKAGAAATDLLEALAGSYRVAGVELQLGTNTVGSVTNQELWLIAATQLQEVSFAPLDSGPEGGISLTAAEVTENAALLNRSSGGSHADLWLETNAEEGATAVAAAEGTPTLSDHYGLIELEQLVTASGCIETLLTRIELQRIEGDSFGLQLQESRSANSSSLCGVPDDDDAPHAVTLRPLSGGAFELAVGDHVEFLGATDAQGRLLMAQDVRVEEDDDQVGGFWQECHMVGLQVNESELQGYLSADGQLMILREEMLDQAQMPSSGALIGMRIRSTPV